jgi:hypothetical protein
MKKIFLITILSLAIFLLVPIDRVEAKEWHCTINDRLKTCLNINVDYETQAEQKCADFCTSKSIQPVNCNLALYTCPDLNKDYRCELQDKSCVDMRALDDNDAEQKCKKICSDKGQKGGVCNYALYACPKAGNAGPLAGASVDALKAQAGSLNKLGITDIPQLISRFINLLMAFIGSIALALYIYSGFLWMTASGNSEQTGKAKTTMVWTTLGVVMMLASYMVASFIFNAIPK